MGDDECKKKFQKCFYNPNRFSLDLKSHHHYSSTLCRFYNIINEWNSDIDADTIYSGFWISSCLEMWIVNMGMDVNVDCGTLFAL